MIWVNILPALLCIKTISATAHREHKVHNIVLYPDKHSWCNATPIKQVVGQPGCDPVEVENSVCVGGCFSYSIPRTEPQAPGEVAPYCDSCQPSAVTWKHVTLKCRPGEYEGETLTKRVQIIRGCQCSSCMRHKDVGQGEGQGGDQTNHGGDVPQLLDLVYTSNNASGNGHHNKHHHHFDSETNHRLSLLLKRLTEEEDSKGGLGKESLEAILTDIKEEKVAEDVLPASVHHTEAEHEDHSAASVSQEQSNIDTLPEPLHRIDHNHLHRPINHHESEVAVDIIKLRHMLGPHHKHHHSKLEEAEEEEGRSRLIEGKVIHKPTVDVASHHLKPALAGSEISYHGDRHTLAHMAQPQEHHSPNP